MVPGPTVEQVLHGHSAQALCAPGLLCGRTSRWARRLCARRELDAIYVYVYVYDYDSTLRFSPELRPSHDLGSALPHLDSDAGSASARFHPTLPPCPRGRHARPPGSLRLTLGGTRAAGTLR